MTNNYEWRPDFESLFWYFDLQEKGGDESGTMSETELQQVFTEILPELGRNSDFRNQINDWAKAYPVSQYNDAHVINGVHGRRELTLRGFVSIMKRVWETSPESRFPLRAAVNIARNYLQARNNSIIDGTGNDNPPPPPPPPPPPLHHNPCEDVQDDHVRDEARCNNNADQLDFATQDEIKDGMCLGKHCAEKDSVTAYRTTARPHAIQGYQPMVPIVSSGLAQLHGPASIRHPFTGNDFSNTHHSWATLRGGGQISGGGNDNYYYKYKKYKSKYMRMFSKRFQ